MLFVKPYYEYGDRRRWRVHTKAAVLLLAVLVMVIAGQFLYPRNRALPLVKIGSSAVGFKNTQAIARQARQVVAGRSVLITAGRKNYAASLAELGITADGEQSAKLATAYSWKARLVPFSSIWLPLLQDMDFIPNYDESKLRAFAEKVDADLGSEPVDASVTFENGRAKVVEAKEGYNYTTDEIYTQLKVADIDKPHMSITGSTKTATIATAAAQSVAERINKIIDAGFSLTTDGKATPVAVAELAKWFVVTPQGKTLELKYDTEAISAQLQQLSTNIFDIPAPAPTSSSTQPTAGTKMIDVTTTAADIVAQLNAGKTTATVAIMDIPTVTINGKKYPKSQQGLAVLLYDLAKSHKGSIAIKYQEQSSRKWEAGFDTSKQFTQASTYKLFVAYLTLKNVQDGKWKLTDKTSTGNTIQGCVEKAIVNSDNACAESLLAKLGGNTPVTKTLNAAGYTKTDFAPMLSTADDQTLLLNRLFSNELLNKDYTDMLLGYMKRQVYRQGIPKGTGLVVADKVGFLDGLLHDSAIVYAQGRPYTLVIYTDQSSWTDIADIAAKIEQFLK